VSMALALIVSAIVTRVLVSGQTRPILISGLILLMVGVQLLSWPILDWFILQTNHGWAFVYAFLVAIGIIIGSSWSGITTATLTVGTLLIWWIPFHSNPDQKFFYDKLVASQETKKGHVHQVQWQDDLWIHYNRQLSATSMDAHMYYEPLVHPIMHLAGPQAHVLLFGGDNGFALRELQKYGDANLKVVPYDAEFLQSSVAEIDFDHSTEEIFYFLSRSTKSFDAIIVDLPDPVNATTSQYYSVEFYEACSRRLHADGLLVTQGGSPYVQADVFQSIKMSIEAAGFETQPLHNQVPSLGEWGWVLSSKSPSSRSLKERLLGTPPDVPTVWWNKEATAMMLSFGKQGFFLNSQVDVNRIDNPTILTYRRTKR